VLTDTQTLKLSRIYRSCVNSIEDILGVSIDHSDEQVIIEVLQETVEKAVVVMEASDDV
jgi:hypothetical protein